MSEGKCMSDIADRFLGAILLVCVAIAIPGCTDPNQREFESIQTETLKPKENRDSLREAFRYLPQLNRLERTAAIQEINLQLNTWSKSVTAPPEWNPSGLLESLSASLRTIDFAERTNKLEFAEPECEYMLQCQIMRQISQWVLDRPYRDRLFKDWLVAQKTSLPSDEGARLETVLKLFDWSICNVALEGNSEDVERLITNPDGQLSDSAPVYRQLPWQTVMFARGDAWERARVFTQLCFSQGIDSVVLAIPSLTGATENSALRLWCVGVPIGTEIYLFEPRWGLPIPNPNGPGIATLAQTKSDPNVLRKAKLPGRFGYPVEQKDLANVVALVDAEPFAVGRAMYTLERSLTGDGRQRLSLDGDAFEKRLMAIDPKLQVRLWNAPWLAHVYNMAVRKRLDDMSPFSLAYMERFGIFITDTPISRARMLHFKGQFESTINAAGALRTYMDFRVDEETLRELMYDRELQRSFGVVKRPNEPMESFQGRLQLAQNFFRRSKFDIGIFLAMANMDLNKPETAIDWLTKRLLDVKGTDRWHAHAHYLLGRNFETLEDSASAIEQYKFEATPQAAGNRIRIRRLEMALNPASAAEVNQ
ncbi:MAG: hypothetical protein WCI02_10080 [Planctomycetota bacterium]